MNHQIPRSNQSLLSTSKANFDFVNNQKLHFFFFLFFEKRDKISPLRLHLGELFAHHLDWPADRHPWKYHSGFCQSLRPPQSEENNNKIKEKKERRNPGGELNWQESGKGGVIGWRHGEPQIKIQASFLHDLALPRNKKLLIVRKKRSFVVGKLGKSLLSTLQKLGVVPSDLYMNRLDKSLGFGNKNNGRNNNNFKFKFKTNLVF